VLQVAEQYECETGHRIDDAWLTRFIEHLRLMDRYEYLELAERSGVQTG
jgi:hypothetical protein